MKSIDLISIPHSLFVLIQLNSVHFPWFVLMTVGFNLSCSNIPLSITPSNVIKNNYESLLSDRLPQDLHISLLFFGNWF